MDTVRASGGRSGDDREGIGGETVAIGTDERRMQVRAYNHWVSLLAGRPYPSIDDLDPGSIADFGSNSVLLDFGDGVGAPSIRFLGRALREECGLPGDIRSIAEVPTRSLLSRLTDHYLQIIANQAPIGFEAEFVGTRGHPTMYRGILMPFSSDGATIDFIYGVINWKEMVDDATQARLTAELEAARRSAPAPTVRADGWADGPGSALVEDGIDPMFAPVLPSPADNAEEQLRALPAIGEVAVECEDEFVLLLARRTDDGTAAVLGRLDVSPAVIGRAIAHFRT